MLASCKILVCQVTNFLMQPRGPKGRKVSMLHHIMFTFSVNSRAFLVPLTEARRLTYMKTALSLKSLFKKLE